MTDQIGSEIKHMEEGCRTPELDSGIIYGFDTI